VSTSRFSLTLRPTPQQQTHGRQNNEQHANNIRDNNHKNNIRVNNQKNKKNIPLGVTFPPVPFYAVAFFPFFLSACRR